MNHLIQKHLVLASVLVLGCSYPVMGQTDDEILKLVLSSFESQKSLFDNIKVQCRLTQQHFKYDPATGSAKELPGESKITQQAYQLNKDGRFILTVDSFVRKTEQEEPQRIAGTGVTAFNGQIYRYESRTINGEAGLGSIFPPERPYDSTKPMIKFTFFMDHLFNAKLLDVLKKGEDIRMSRTEDEVVLEHGTADRLDYYKLECDPAKDYLVTRMTGGWTESATYEKTMEYDVTKEGFYYLKRGTFHIGDEEPSVMEVTSFALNGPEEDYNIAFPVGTRVTDYREGFPKIYYEGQPGRTGEESGDLSIYAVADQLNRFAVHGPQAEDAANSVLTKEHAVSGGGDEKDATPQADKEAVIATQANPRSNTTDKVSFVPVWSVLLVVAVLAASGFVYLRRRS